MPRVPMSMLACASLALIVAAPAAGQLGVQIEWEVAVEAPEGPLATDRAYQMEAPVTRHCPSRTAELPQASGTISVYTDHSAGEPQRLGSERFVLPGRNCLQEATYTDVVDVRFIPTRWGLGDQVTYRVFADLDAEGDALMGYRSLDPSNFTVLLEPVQATTHETAPAPSQSDPEHLGGADALLVMVVLGGFAWLLWAVRPPGNDPGS